MVILALGLCGLCAFQWVRETKLRMRVEELQAERQKLNDEKTVVEAQGKRFQEEIQRVERERADLFKSAQTNNEALVKIRVDLAKANLEVDRSKRASDNYKDAFEKANDAIRLQNERTAKQNAEFAKFQEERKEFVEKYNALVKQHDANLTQYNDLVAKWNVQQDELKNLAEAKK